MLSKEDQLSAAVMVAERRYPYFGVGLAGMVRRFTSMVPTMGVSKNGVLYINPDFLATMNPSQAGEVVAHELMHLLRRHCQRADVIPEVDREIWNVAADAEINDDLKFDLLPEGKILPSTFGAQNGMMAEEYYGILMKRAKQSKQSQGGQGKDGGESGGKGVARGQCGSGAGGDPSPGEEEAIKDAKGRSQADLDRMRQSVASAIGDHATAKGRGSVPGGLLVWSEMELQPPKIRWQDILHRSIRARYAECAGKVDYSRTRFSKRQAVYSACATAFGGKMAVMPSLCAPKPRVCIGVDTSGSMGKGDLLDAVSEANGVIKAIGSEVTFLACDAEIHGEPRVVNSTSELVNGLRGGGGTDFRPLFEAVENLRHPVDVFIFLTDGMGPAPDVEPMGFKTIWVLIGSNAVEPCSWGTHVRTE